MAHILPNTRLLDRSYDKYMGQIRITGGLHRSRKITVDDQPGLRPTTDRIRETLFNWLGQNLTGYHVLDLYTGSGILAFEAASRGATSVTCIDNNPKTLKQLQLNIELLKLTQISYQQQQALRFVEGCKNTYDLIFLDPPFDSDEMNRISDIILPLVNIDGWVYREYGIDQSISTLDNQFWSLIKQKKAGQVQFEIWQKL